MTRLEAWLLGLSSLTAAGSGLLLFVMKHLLEPQDPYAVIHHPLQPAVLRLHLLAVPFLIFSVGMIMPVHIIKKMRDGKRRGRVSGLATLTLFTSMVLSGVLIQMLVAEIWLWIAVWVHLVTGCLYGISVLIHRRVRHQSPASQRGQLGPPISGRGPQPVGRPGR